MTSPDTLTGSVERITYYNEDTNYCVLRLRPDQFQLGREELITVVGNMPEVQPGESVRLEGQWTNHPKHGRQFRTENMIQIRPASAEAIRRYLGSGLIKGVGPVTARRIVDFFGTDTLDVLDRTPQRLLDVPGVGKHRTKLIGSAWIEQQHIKEVMLFLQGHNVTTGLAVKIYKQYGDQAIQIVSNNPYRLADDIRGIGFRTADKIAQNLGLPPDAPSRIAAGVKHALNEATDEGHVYLPRHTLVEQAAELLGVAPDADEPTHPVEDAIQRTAQRSEIMIEVVPAGLEQVEAVYLPPMYYSEKGAAARLRQLNDTPASRLDDMHRTNWDRLLADLAGSSRVQLTDQQQNAVRQALTHKVSVLTGGPGTGKTTTLRAVIGALDRTRHRFMLASPTGRAAKRMSEATGHPARTIHRLLGFSPAQRGFVYNEENPLDTDMLIVDEASMIDLMLFYSLLKALRPDTHLLLVGDIDQLPSVGAGNVLHDVIESGIGPVTRLNTIFRQADTSQIIYNAHRINRGDVPDTSSQNKDFFLFVQEDPVAAGDLLVEIVQERIPNKFGYDPVDDIQVLSPMYRGPVGVSALNQTLQERLNPSNPRIAERRLGGLTKRLFRVGDKVIQTRNNYEKDVFNGDIGRVRGFDITNQIMTVVIDERIVKYDWAEVDDLTHAYCISVHRSQGSEYPCVVIPVVTQHYMMLQRNLLYTAITRAKELVVLVGTRKAIAIAVQNDRVAQRWSALAWRIHG
ncbi:MAG: ATP-dependent RecD-like DNA helicase [Anaerolineae bacterium]|nr:ATP-dependent RecD-like DNA helicase [Anaerolineae bacterium]